MSKKNHLNMKSVEVETNKTKMRNRNAEFQNNTNHHLTT